MLTPYLMIFFAVSPSLPYFVSAWFASTKHAGTHAFDVASSQMIAWSKPDGEDSK
jgi:hypothetical protein